MFLLTGVLDHARGRVLARAGARLQARLDPVRAARSWSVRWRRRSAPCRPPACAIWKRSSGSPPATAPLPFFGAPRTPVFLIVLFTFHWMLGVLAEFLGLLLLVVALINQARTGAAGGCRTAFCPPSRSCRVSTASIRASCPLAHLRPRAARTCSGCHAPGDRVRRRGSRSTPSRGATFDGRRRCPRER